MLGEANTIGIIEVRMTAADVGQALQSYEALFSTVRENIGLDGSLFVVADNSFYRSQLVPWPPILAEHLAKFDFKLKNMFIWFREQHTLLDKNLASVHSSILFMVKSFRDYFFDKDSIREPHIFKDIEWGKRKTGTSGYHKERESLRYPEKGRDPGNLFHKARRDKQGQVQAYLPYPEAELFERLVNLTSKPEWTIITNWPSLGIDSIIEKMDRKLHRLEVDV